MYLIECINTLARLYDFDLYYCKSNKIILFNSESEDTHTILLMHCANANHAYKEDRKSHPEYIFIVLGCVIS